MIKIGGFMKNINKILLILLAAILISGCGDKKEDKDKTPNDNKEPKEVIYLFDHEFYNGFNFDDVESLEVVRYTIAGDQRQTISSQEEVEQIYNMLKNIKIGEKNGLTCEDNTTVYVFTMKNSKKYTVTFDCEWLIIGKDSYTAEK